MRKQLHEIQDTDRYILDKMTSPEKLLFQVKMILSPVLKENVQLQEKAHQFIRWSAREELREKLDTIHTLLMKDASFREKISSIFK
ncbi:hypothetical protein [Chitinophaga tropicalis]|uniref:Uncharacterized protein n=1 Tax=Chitinophaga tropicalis TaxID=2683588 RepID=A0A7K1U3N2_9BACT|nr:hypothetical protein [Chitinophaga tropicalis]MVT08977.1 hypothetical protein [Chitinophaga tropicalis]